MKNSDLKSQVKSARKSAASDIEESLTTALKKVAAKLGQNSKHFTKEIEKGSKRLAKKLSKEIEFAEPAVSEASTANKNANGVEKPKPSPKSDAKPVTLVKAEPAGKKATVKSNGTSKPVNKNNKPV
jgi:hypothetical protein